MIKERLLPLAIAIAFFAFVDFAVLPKTYTRQEIINGRSVTLVCKASGITGIEFVARDACNYYTMQKQVKHKSCIE